MTVQASRRKAGPYIGTGGVTIYAFSFKTLDPTHIQVVQAIPTGEETVLTLGTHYTVALNRNQDTSPGGSITLLNGPLQSNYRLTILSVMPYSQTTDIPTGGQLDEQTLEGAFDKLEIQVQQLAEQTERSVKLPPTSSESAEALVDDLQRIADSANNLDTVAGAISNVNAVGADITKVNTVADAIGNVNTVAANVANVNTVAGISANVTTVANNAANVATVAGAIGTVDAVAAAVAAAAESQQSAAESAVSAEVAQVQAELATAQNNLATAAKVAAEAARDAAFVNAAVYTSTEAGLAATTVGQQFQVVAGDGLSVLRYRHDTGPVATLVATYPSKAAVDGIFATERVVLSQNLLDKDDLVFERYSHISDTITVSATQDATNFIRVIPGRRYYFRQSSGFRHAILGFTSRSNTSNIGRVGLPSTFGNYSFVMPANVNFVKVGLVGSGETRDPALFTQFSLSLGDWLPDTNLTYSGFYSNTTGNGLPFRITTGSLSEVITQTAATYNLLDYSNILTNVFVNDTYTDLGPASGWSVSDFIPCAANETFTFAGIRDFFERRILYYAADGTSITGATLGLPSLVFPGDSGPFASERYLQFTIPNNPSIVAFRITVHASDPTFADGSTRFRVYKGIGYRPFVPYRVAAVVDGVQYAPSQERVLESVSSFFRRPTSFTDKTFAIIGDSITSNAVWVTRFSERIRPKAIHNYSAGGRRLVSTTGTVNPASLQNAGPDAAYQMAQDITNNVIAAPDYVIIFLGANEFGKTPDTTVAESSIDAAFTNGGTSLVALGSVDLTKIPGALRYMVQTIGQVAPSTKFFIVTPIPNTLNGWNSQKNVGNSIRWTAQRMSIPVIDLQARSNILTLWDYPAGVATYRNLVDGVHPFGTGVTETPATRMIAEQIASEFLNYVLVSP